MQVAFFYEATFMEQTASLQFVLSERAIGDGKDAINRVRTDADQLGLPCTMSD